MTATFLIRDKNPSKPLVKELKMISDPHLFWVLHSYIGISEQFCKVKAALKAANNFVGGVGVVDRKGKMRSLGWAEGTHCERTDLPLIAFDLLLSTPLSFT